MNDQLIIELLPYIIGSVITIVVLRLILLKFDRRPLSSPSLYFSYAPDPAIVAELQVMFQNIPRAYIVRELDRAEGVQSVAIDALLLLNPDFAGSNGNNEEFVTPDLSNHNKNYRNLLNEIVRSEEVGSGSRSGSDGSSSVIDSKYDETPVIKTTQITKKDWDSTTPRERLCALTERKRLMLLKAREHFRKSQEQQ